MSKEKLSDILKTLQTFTDFPIKLIDNDGETLMSFGGEAKYCSLLNQSGIPSNVCRITHMNAGGWAQKLGEAYIFPVMPDSIILPFH